MGADENGGKIMNVELCQKALRLNPELWYTVQVAARVDSSTFPLETLEQLIAATVDEGKSHAQLDGITISAENALDHFPQVFLPIVDEDDLLTKLYAAFCAGREFHHAEQRVTQHKRAVAESRS
ncbi:MAG TPA: hypothetical protein VGB75_08520 [Jatrophihabitans sp.]|uniref:hypothetical protein n=1 Tax=Jatrophihabitans sp. TaxID=1932789 RepID=UPI002F05D4B5